MLFPLLAAAQGAVVTTEQVRAELVAHAPEGLEPGKPAWLGLLIKHQPHWHTYWRNPGDSGLPTRMDWQLPAGVTVGEIQWPTPQRLPVGPLVNYGYEGELLLAVPLTIGPEFKGGSLKLQMLADWLVCKEVCIPESGEFSLELPAAAATAGHAAQFERARAGLPQALQA
ncbi:protein-disulfide reductase DsbD domain-containing protein, partial [Paucibacter sp. XJ19-41]